MLVLLSGCATIEPGRAPLQVEALQLRLHGAALEKLGQIDWSIITSGAEGEVIFELRSLKQGLEAIEFQGPLSKGKWTPNKPGSYRLKAIVTDEAGRKAENDWSATFKFEPALNKDSLYAVLPLENLSDSRAPMDEIYHGLLNRLNNKGFKLLDQTDLENFMRHQRMRHVGGINSQLGALFQNQTRVDGILLTSLETWQTAPEPRISLIMRLVTSGISPEIVWIDSVGLTGDDSPGLLGLGRIKKTDKLLDKAYKQLLASLENYLAGVSPQYRNTINPARRQLLNGSKKTSDEALQAIAKHHLPQFSYRSSTFDPALKYRVAVIPFLNINARKHAGKIVALHIVKQLQRYENIRVYEPGLVRETLLRYRMIMQSGPSLAASDVLSNEKILGADLVFSGKVFDYQGDVGESKVDFSLQAFDGRKREVVWASRSYATGNAGVYLYDWGKIPSAHGLASRMTHTVIEKLEE